MPSHGERDDFACQPAGGRGEHGGGASAIWPNGAGSVLSPPGTATGSQLAADLDESGQFKLQPGRQPGGSVPIRQGLEVDAGVRAAGIQADREVAQSYFLHLLESGAEREVEGAWRSGLE